MGRRETARWIDRFWLPGNACSLSLSLSLFHANVHIINNHLARDAIQMPIEIPARPAMRPHRASTGDDSFSLSLSRAREFPFPPPLERSREFTLEEEAKSAFFPSSLVPTSQCTKHMSHTRSPAFPRAPRNIRLPYAAALAGSGSQSTSLLYPIRRVSAQSKAHAAANLGIY